MPLYSRFRLPATRRGFEQMNQALRERAEAKAAGGGGRATEERAAVITSSGA